MKLKFRVLISVLCIILLIPNFVFAKDIVLNDSPVTKLSIPDNYVSCTRTECDDELNRIFEGNKINHETFVSGNMIPANWYLYAGDIKTQQYIYLSAIKSTADEKVKNKDGSITHKLMDDYNLADTEEDKNKITDDIKTALVSSGSKISSIEWLNISSNNTPYVECIFYVTGTEKYNHMYKTIYNANTIDLRFESDKEFTQEELDKHLLVLESLTHDKNIDYTEVENIINENQRKKQEKETHSGKNTRLLRYALSVSIGLVIVFAIYMAIRTQSRKRRNVVLKNDDSDSEE